MSQCMYSHGFPLPPLGFFEGDTQREKENLAYRAQNLKVEKLFFFQRFSGCIFSNAGFHKIVRDWKRRKNLKIVYKNSSLDLICRYCSRIGRLTHQCTKIAYDTSELAAIRFQGRYFDNPYQELLLRCLRSSFYPFHASLQELLQTWASTQAAATAVAKIAETVIRDLLYLPPVCRTPALPFLWLRQQKSKWVLNRNWTWFSSQWHHHVFWIWCPKKSSNGWLYPKSCALLT